MRILVVCRLMSGFEQSVLSGVWNPSGAPAIRHVIEHLDRGGDTLNLIMTRLSAKAPLARRLQAIDGQVIELEGLRTPVRVLFSGPEFLGRATVYWRDLLHTWKVWREVRRTRPELIYVDRSNVFGGAVLARITRVPVVLRMLGVPPDLWAIIDGRRPAERLLRWAYRAPFALVIGSMDGSGSEGWMRKALAPSVPRQVLLNGVDRDGGSPPLGWLSDLVGGKIVVTLLGRVEALKGADFFIEALLALPSSSNDRIHALVVGDGELLEPLRQRVAAAGIAGRVTFTGALPHAEVRGVLAASHIYVSLNRQGQLSNANLEAMASGTCLVVKRKRAGEGDEGEFDGLLSPRSYIALDADDGPQKLAAVLAEIANDPAKRQEMVAAVDLDLKGKLRSWGERIEYELHILQDIAGRRR